MAGLVVPVLLNDTVNHHWKVSCRLEKHLAATSENLRPVLLRHVKDKWAFVPPVICEIYALDVNVYDVPDQENLSHTHVLSLADYYRRAPVCVLLFNRLKEGRFVHLLGWVCLQVNAGYAKGDCPPIVVKQQNVSQLLFTSIGDERRQFVKCNETNLSHEWRSWMRVERCGHVQDWLEPQDEGMEVEFDLACAVAATTFSVAPETRLLALLKLPVGDLATRALSRLAEGTQDAPPATIDTLLCAAWLLYPRSTWSRDDLLVLIDELLPVEIHAFLTECTNRPCLLAPSWKSLCTSLLEQLILDDWLDAQLRRAPLSLLVEHVQEATPQTSQALVAFHDLQECACRWFLSSYANKIALAKLHRRPTTWLLPCIKPERPALSVLREIASYPGFANEYDRSLYVDLASVANNEDEAAGFTGLFIPSELDKLPPLKPAALVADFEMAPRCIRNLIVILTTTRHLSHSEMNVLVPVVYNFWRNQAGEDRQTAFRRTLDWFAQQGTPLVSIAHRPSWMKPDAFSCKAYTLLKKRFGADTIADKTTGESVAFEASCRTLIRANLQQQRAHTCSVCPFYNQPKQDGEPEDIENLCRSRCAADLKERRLKLTQRQGLPSLVWLDICKQVVQ